MPWPLVSRPPYNMFNGIKHSTRLCTLCGKAVLEGGGGGLVRPAKLDAPLRKVCHKMATIAQEKEFARWWAERIPVALEEIEAKLDRFLDNGDHANASLIIDWLHFQWKACFGTLVHPLGPYCRVKAGWDCGATLTEAEVGNSSDVPESTKSDSEIPPQPLK